MVKAEKSIWYTVAGLAEAENPWTCQMILENVSMFQESRYTVPRLACKQVKSLNLTWHYFLSLDGTEPPTMWAQSRHRPQQGQCAIGSAAKHSVTKCSGFALGGNTKVGHGQK